MILYCTEIALKGQAFQKSVW